MGLTRPRCHQTAATSAPTAAGLKDVAVIDTATRTIAATISLPLVNGVTYETSPVRIAVSPEGNRAYVAESGQVAVLDLVTFKALDPLNQ
jgi:DNA-binding beta-propeller fold protein YncE